jgi:hypothetical protein
MVRPPEKAAPDICHSPAPQMGGSGAVGETKSEPNGVMSAAEFTAAVGQAGLTVYNCGEALGISRRSAYSFSRGERPVSVTVAKLLRLLTAQRW